MLENDHLALPEFYSETHPFARVQHTCCECQRTINKRDRYVRVSGRWDDYFACHKFCARCWRLRKKIETKTNYAIGFGMLRETLAEAKEYR